MEWLARAGNEGQFGIGKELGDWGIRDSSPYPLQRGRRGRLGQLGRYTEVSDVKSFKPLPIKRIIQHIF
jgi:hypothetical protein